MAAARFRPATALLLAVVMLGAYVAPTTAAAGLRAARCCAERCAKPRSATAASQCCQVMQASVDVGAFSVPDQPLPPRTLGLVGVLPAGDPSAPVIASRDVQSTSSARAAPIFLQNLSLRI